MDRLMPDSVKLGQQYSTVMTFPMSHWTEEDTGYEINGRRTVMGYILPEWQRPLVWTEDQMIKFIESIWRGLPIGTFSYNRVHDGGPTDGLLIDGQQRMYSLQRYLEDAFPVFGYRWSEVTSLDKRVFQHRTFASYETNTTDEDYLREYYNLMNFGGVAHTEDQRA